MTCKTCKFLDVPPGTKVIRRQAYRCLWKMPELKLPDSITKAVGFHPNPVKCRVWPEDGVNCPVQETRT